MPFTGRALSVALLVVPFAALAGGTATLQGGTKDGPAIIAWRDAQNVILKDGTGYALLRNGKSYLVLNPGGRTIVLDTGVGLLAKIVAKEHLAYLSASFKPTGKAEIVAGILGHIYHATWTNGDGTHEGEAVLTSDRRVVEMTQAYLSLVDSLGGDAKARTAFKLPRAEPGLLRLGKDFRVLKISNKAPPANIFELPAKPTGMLDMFWGGGH